MAHKLFLGGVSPNTTTEIVQDHFSKYGTVVDAIVMYKDGKHRGFGFVTFDSEDAMNAALGEEQVIDGRAIDVKPAVPQAEAPTSRLRLNGGGAPGKAMAALPASRPNADSTPCDKVFLGGLAQTTTEDMVKDYFSQYGTIIDCVVMKDKATGRSRGFGFVQYDSTEPVEQVMGDYSNHQIDGKWVEVKKAIPQDRLAVPARSTGGKGAAASGTYSYSPAFGSSFGKGASPAYGAGWQYGAGYGSAAGRQAPASYGGYGHSGYGYYPQPTTYAAYGGFPSYGSYGAAPRTAGALRQGSRPY